MNAFTAAARALHADNNLSVAATYTPAPARSLAALAVRAILSEPLEAMGMAGSGATVRGKEASLAADALPYAPRKGDTMTIGADVFRVERVEQDIERTAWRLVLGA